ncbi:hypothetical protein pb186bvf_013079 [Paramecium bursaria]
MKSSQTLSKTASFKDRLKTNFRHDGCVSKIDELQEEIERLTTLLSKTESRNQVLIKLNGELYKRNRDLNEQIKISEDKLQICQREHLQQFAKMKTDTSSLSTVIQRLERENSIQGDQIIKLKQENQSLKNQIDDFNYYQKDKKIIQELSKRLEIIESQNDTQYFNYGSTKYTTSSNHIKQTTSNPISKITMNTPIVINRPQSSQNNNLYYSQTSIKKVQGMSDRFFK